MKKIPFSNLDLDLYQTKLENGLEIYVVPMTNVDNIYTTFTTKYGSRHSTFVPIGEKKMVTVPDGIAHFLEHKLFEQSDGVDPFTFFSTRGTDANAFTNKNQTTYLFSGPNFFEENINFLLDYVQSPYFTDENVEKEKGIIESEIKMYQDKPYSVLYDEVLANNIVKDPMRIPIAGTIESINKITKEDLYMCYNTFYHPSNMFVVITGNVNPESVIELIKNNQASKDFPAIEPIKLKKIKEPYEILKKSKTIKMNVTIPKVALTFKIPLNKFKDLPSYEVSTYITRFFNLKFGSTSEFNEQMIKLGLINKNLSIFQQSVNDDFTIVTIDAETVEPKKLVKLIKEELKNTNIEEKDFARKNKVTLSSLVMRSDNVYDLNRSIMNDIIDLGEVRNDRYNQIKDYNYKNFKTVIDKLVLDKDNYIIIDPKD